MAEDGFAVTLYREGGNWQCDLLPPAVMTDLGTCVAVLRQQPPEGGPMALVDVEDEFFLALRLAPGGAVRLLLSDVTAAAEWDLARQALRRLGEAMPATSTPGPTGPTGPTGPAGPAGPAGPTGQFGQAALAGPGEFGDEAVPAGDLGLFADLGLPEADLRAVLDDTELYADEMLAVITRRIGVGSAYARVVDSLSS